MMPEIITMQNTLEGYDISVTLQPSKIPHCCKLVKAMKDDEKNVLYVDATTMHLHKDLLKDLIMSLWLYPDGNEVDLYRLPLQQSEVLSYWYQLLKADDPHHIDKLKEVGISLDIYR